MITVILTTYKRPLLLKRAIESLPNNVTIAVYDNASNDGTKEIVAEFGDRVSYFEHHENIGLARNAEFGRSRVITPYYTFLSDDDITLPGFYDEAIALLTKYPDSPLCIGRVYYQDEHATILKPSAKHAKELFSPKEATKAFITGRFPSWQAMIFRKELDLGPLRDDMFAIDSEYVMRHTLSYPVCATNTFGARFTIHTTGASSSANLTHIQELRAKIEALYIDDIKRLGLLDVWIAQEKMDFLLTGIKALVQRRFDVAAQVSRILKKRWFSIFVACCSNKLFYPLFMQVRLIRRRVRSRYYS